MAGSRQKSNKRKVKETEKPKKKVREKVAEVLELPKEIVLNIPRITMVGNGNLLIENYKGIIEYEFDRIRLNTARGVIRVVGRNLVIKEITSEDIMVDGEIKSLEFME